MVDGDPQAAGERRAAARHLVLHPMTCAERHPDLFRLVRRDGAELDRWFTQRLGYRLHVGADTARLFKAGFIPDSRPLRASTGRALNSLEHTLLALALASTAAGPSVISLRDLVGEVRSAAAEAGVVLADDATERRALVAALRWMIDHGLAAELHEHVDTYAADESADAVLRVRPDRIALLLVPAVAGAETVDEVFERAERRTGGASRQWMRARLVEDPVLYRDDLGDDEWGELRRRLGEESRHLDEMFGLVLEARAEGVAAVDPGGTLAERRFPTGGTVGHAALLLIDRLPASEWVGLDDVEAILAELAGQNARRWANDYVDRVGRLVREVVELLCDLRLGSVDDDRFRLRPAASRFVAVEEAAPAQDALQPATLW